MCLQYMYMYLNVIYFAEVDDKKGYACLTG